MDIMDYIDEMDYLPRREEFREWFYEYVDEYSDGNIDYDYYGG